MRFPLIVASRPSEDAKYPLVVLPPGRWRFISSDITDSVFHVETSDSQVELQEELEILRKTPLRLVCTSAGTETSITVFACLSH